MNTEAETAFCLEVAREVAGEGRARIIEPAMASEDFAFLLQAKPGCYIFLGNGDGDHRHAGHGLGPCMLHNASYDFNDALIAPGASYCGWRSAIWRPDPVSESRAAGATRAGRPTDVLPRFS